MVRPKQKYKQQFSIRSSEPLYCSSIFSGGVRNQRDLENQTIQETVLDYLAISNGQWYSICYVWEVAGLIPDNVLPWTKLLPVAPLIEAKLC